MPNPVVHFEILGTNGAKLQDFYRSLFGWTIDANNPMQYGLVAPDEKLGVGGGIAAAPPQAPPSVTIYVQVDDLAGYLKKAESLGGKTIVPPTEIPNMVTFAQFQDPDGNIIGLVKG
jgi:predicted enzyme related to lactoylglutathione lyase